MAVDESDFWGQLTLAPMSSFSQFGVGEGGRNVFDALAQLFALVTTVRLFGPFPQVFKYFSPRIIKNVRFVSHAGRAFCQLSALSTGDGELKRQDSLPEQHLIRFEILIKAITGGNGRSQWL